MSTSQPDNPVDTPPEPDAAAHAPNAGDAHALAKAGAEAASQAPAGTDPATLKRLIREAVKEEADERNLKGFGDAEAQMIAGSVIMALESRGAFANNPEPEPVNPPANTDPNAGTAAAQQPSSDGDTEPQRLTWAQKFLRGNG